MKTRVTVALLLCAATTAIGCSNATGRAPKIREGECWSYDSRPGEEGSFIVVRKIDHLRDVGEVVFVTVHGARIVIGPNPHEAVGIGPLPIAGESLRSSLKSRLDVDVKKWPQDSWRHYYQRWHEVYDSKGTAVVVRISIREWIDELESMRKRANQALQPTPGSVTPRAKE